MPAYTLSGTEYDGPYYGSDDGNGRIAYGGSGFNIYPAWNGSGWSYVIDDASNFYYQADSNYSGPELDSYSWSQIGVGSGSPVFTLLIVAPTVSTGSVTSITSSGATIAGSSVTDNGGEASYGVGVHVSTSSGFSSYDTFSGWTGSHSNFNVVITGRTPGTLYYARAYANNSAGYGYGGTVSFTPTSAGAKHLALLGVGK